jgi:prevent-host-death family protein
MKTVPISDFRQRAAEILDELRDGEPAVLLQRSKKVAYLVGSDEYERDQAELAALRRGLFLAEVREAEAEYRAGESKAFDTMDDLLAELGR